MLVLCQAWCGAGAGDLTVTKEDPVPALVDLAACVCVSFCMEGGGHRVPKSLKPVWEQNRNL